jgi:hypothetical protein
VTNLTDDLVGLNRARHQHDSCQSNVGLQGIMLIEAYRRMKCGIYGSPPGKPTPEEKAYGMFMWFEGHYCLDAPDVLPAGGMEGLDLNDEELGIVPHVMTVMREGASE